MSFLLIPIGTYPNTFLGYQSLVSITTGIDNTAFGYESLKRLRSGSSNSAFGHGALGTLTTGTNNTAIGYLSQEDNLTGTLNVSVGARSLWNNISGNANVAIGEFALSSSTIANQNVAIGYESGKFMTTGSKNCILGSFTGFHPLIDIRTLSNYVVLSNGDGDPLLWITPTGNVNIPGGLALTGSLSITGGTVTANNPVLSATQTWNNAAVTFTGWQLNVTDTASNASSLLMNLQVGGGSKFYVGKDGIIGNAIGLGSLWINRFGTNSIVLYGAGTGNAWGVDVYSNISVNINSTLPLGWSTALYSVSDLQLWRDAANTLAQRNGVNAQTLRVYNTFTDASNYERAALQWQSNELQLRVDGAGTGQNRPFQIVVASQIVAYFNSTGNRSVALGVGAVATNATSGFVYVPTCAGTPTGIPETYTGRAPIVVDTTNNKLYFYSGGAWRDAGP